MKTGIVAPELPTGSRVLHRRQRYVRATRTDAGRPGDRYLRRQRAGRVDGRDHEGAERRAARRRGDGERAARAVDAAVEAELAEHAPAGESGRSTAAARGGAGRVVTGGPTVGPATVCGPARRHPGRHARG